MSAANTLVRELRFPEFQEDTEWKEGTLAAAATIAKKKISVKGLSLADYATTENIQPNFGNLSCASNLPNVKSVTQFLPGDTLFANIRPYLKKAVFANREGGASNDVIVFRSRDTVSPEFLSLRIRSDAFVDYVMSGAKGLKMPRGDVEQMKAFPFPLPSPAEQQKIADCLGSLDDLIAAHRRKLDALQDHKKGLLQQLFPAEGKTTPKLRFPEFEGDGEWIGKTLQDLAIYRRGSFPQPYGNPEWFDEENGVPFIQVYDVADNFRLKPKTKTKISKVGAKKSVFIPEGTLIITIQGSIGRVAITQYDAYIDRTLLLFKEFKQPVCKEFFAQALSLLFEIEKRKAPGGIIKTITKEALNEFPLILPELPEQQKIADCLSALDALITAQTEQLAALKAHKKGLMQKLFPNPERK